MNNSTLSYPYRRYSSDIYAAGLIELLSENEIAFEIITEPEGVGSVFLGSGTLPGIVVMVSANDVGRISALEKELSPQQHAPSREPEQEEPVASGWIILGYLFSLMGAPIALIAGLHLFTARRRKRDFTSTYAYDSSARFHGKLIFSFALFILVFSFANLFTGARMSFLDTFSFIIWQLDHWW